eukprot:CAMPEP_0202025838 /NCGR_PEP_ID=MMETSP0905-20130828/57414_1 /ASSEMBLY_ACC=CAM_ASM_000554 /TAXON_ID=420261 /ORGANISM="Thalassiosira antarctica, Strain CCMP982" /LENGTH=89 /DNA_ID=CAMNT_0048588869 /DNA_START=30 /DNA_END=299 /DNA_ORIENTATION=+
MIPTQPHIDITPISSPLVGMSQRRIPTLPNLFHSLDDVRVEITIAPRCATTSTSLSSADQLSSRRSYKIAHHRKKRMNMLPSLNRSLDP